MHIKASLGLYLKNMPKDHVAGVRGQTTNIGDTPLSLDQLIHELAIEVVDFARKSGMCDVFEAQEILEKSVRNILETKLKMDARLEELRQEAERKYADGTLP